MRTILTIADNAGLNAVVENAANTVADAMKELSIIPLSIERLADIDQIVDDTDAALIMLAIDRNTKIQPYLNALRQVRVPYIFLKNDCKEFDPKHILLPVTNLMEEREKGPYASSFARHFSSVVHFVKPHDYGSMAQTNIDVISHLFESLGVEYDMRNAKKDSSKVELETLKFSDEQHRELLIITASRDYGLDDLIFGPKERKIIQRATMPVMLINPRGDLYPLCD